jgi:hypothetical protein
MQNKFIHSGATGDIIFSLPVIKDMGGGTLFITNFDNQRAESIKKIIEVQPYINEVIITNENIEGINLNLFRQHAGHFVNLVDAHYKGQGIELTQWWKNGWLQLPEREKTIKEKYCVINRTTNYADPNFNWHNEYQYLKTLADKIYFIGYKNECELFNNTFNCDAEYYECDFLNAAYLLQGAEMVSVCYSATATIAQGLGIKYRIEQAPAHTCSTFFVERETIINL